MPLAVDLTWSDSVPTLLYVICINTEIIGIHRQLCWSGHVIWMTERRLRRTLFTASSHTELTVLAAIKEATQESGSMKSSSSAINLPSWKFLLLTVRHDEYHWADESFEHFRHFQTTLFHISPSSNLTNQKVSIISIYCSQELPTTSLNITQVLYLLLLCYCYCCHCLYLHLFLILYC